MSKKNKRSFVIEEEFEDDVIYSPERSIPKPGKERNDPKWDPQDHPLQLDNPAEPVPGLQPSRSYRKDKGKEDGKTKKDAKQTTD